MYPFQQKIYSGTDDPTISDKLNIQLQNIDAQYNQQFFKSKGGKKNPIDDLKKIKRMQEQALMFTQRRNRNIMKSSYQSDRDYQQSLSQHHEKGYMTSHAPSVTNKVQTDFDVVTSSLLSSSKQKLATYHQLTSDQTNDESLAETDIVSADVIIHQKPAPSIFNQQEYVRSQINIANSRMGLQSGDNQNNPRISQKLENLKLLESRQKLKTQGLKLRSSYHVGGNNPTFQSSTMSNSNNFSNYQHASIQNSQSLQMAKNQQFVVQNMRQSIKESKNLLSPNSLYVNSQFFSDQKEIGSPVSNVNTNTFSAPKFDPAAQQNSPIRSSHHRTPSKSPRSLQQSPLQAFLTNKNKTSNINVLDNKALLFQTRDIQVSNLQKQASRIQKARQKVRDRGMKSPQFCSLDLYNKISAVDLPNSSFQQAMASQNELVDNARQRMQIMSQRQKVRPILKEMQGQGTEILKIDQQIRTEGTISNEGSIEGTDLDPIKEASREKGHFTIQSSLSQHLDEVQENYSANFDLFPNYQSNNQSNEESSEDQVEQGALSSDRLQKIPRNFLFSDSVEQHQAERIEVMVKNFQEIHDQAKYKLTSNRFGSEAISPMSHQSVPKNYPSRFDKKNSQGVSLFNVTKSGYLSSRVDNFLSPVLFHRENHGPKKDFINGQNITHKRFIIEKRNRNRFLKQNLPPTKSQDRLNRKAPFDTPFCQLLDKEEYTLDEAKAQQVFKRIQDSIKEKTAQKFTFESFFRYLNEKRIQDELVEFQLKIFRKHNEENTKKRDQDWKKEQKRLKLESKEFKEFITDECHKIDVRIADQIAWNKKRQKDIDGFIEGFVRYLETRDKAAILKQNIHKIKKVLRSKEVHDVWNQTKQDQLVRIIEKFEKRDQIETNVNTQEIKGLAINSDAKIQGEFVMFVDSLCEREDSPQMDKHIARKTVNQQFKESMSQNRQNLRENPGEIEFIMSNQQHVDTSIKRNPQRRDTLDLSEKETQLQLTMTKKMARMVSKKTNKLVSSSLLDAITAFADTKGDKRPHIKQLAKELKPFGGIKFMSDMLIFKLQMSKLFKSFNIGEKYKEIRQDNFFDVPPLIQMMDTTRQAQNIVGQVLNVINLNLKTRSKVNAHIKAELDSDSNSSSCMCSSNYSSDSEPPTHTNKSPAERGRSKSKMKKKEKKHQPDCAHGQKMNFKLDELNKQAINKFQAKLQTPSNALAYSNIFKNQIAKNSFYAHAKTSQAFEKAKGREDKIINEDECNRQLENGYLQSCQSNFEKPIPFFSKIVNNSLKLKKEFISDTQALALSQYLINSIKPNLQDFPAHKSNKIQYLHLDDCNVKDEGFSEILKALIVQKKIETICYFNNELGSKSINQLSHLLNNDKSGVKLFTLKLGNLTGVKTKILRQITSDVLLQPSIQKLQISHMNLEDKVVVTNLCAALGSLEHLYSLDLQWGSLKAKSLCQIMDILIQKQKNELQKPIKLAEMGVVRQLNLSYNNITEVKRKGFDVPPPKKKTSAEEAEERKDYDQLFVESLGTYAAQSKCLNHLDISGMGFENIKDRYSLLKLFSKLANSPALQAVHLSDNHFRQDPTMFKKEAEFFEQILNRFGIVPEEEFDPEKKAAQDEIINICRETIDKINMSKHLVNGDKEKTRFVDPLVFKDYYLNSLKTKVVNNQINQANYNRLGEFQLDKVVITRVVRNELACINHGKEMQWKLSKGSECFMCDRHKYTLIFVDKKRLNDGFIKITDPDSIKKLKKSFRLNQCEHSFPQIFGTVTGSWTQQVTCVDAHLYSLINLVDHPKFLNQVQAAQEVSKDIIQGVKSIVHSSMVNVQSLLPLHYYLNEYQIPLHDIVINNEHTDILAVNIPQSVITLSEQMMKFDKKRGNDSSQVPYVYYGVLPPGYHQFLVYIPSQDTFWFKDFVLDANRKDWFPEWPDMFSNCHHQNIVTDVWHVPQSLRKSELTVLLKKHKTKKDEHAEVLKEQRHQLRENNTLIKLLSDNRDGLHFIYEKAQQDNLFTLESAYLIAEQVLPSIQQETVHLLFQDSKLQNAGDNTLKKDHLQEVEFFELICRMAVAEGQQDLLKLNFSDSSVVHKIHITLQKLFQTFEVEINIGEKLCQVCENHDDQKFISAVDRFMLEGNMDFIIGMQMLQKKGHQGHRHNHEGDDHKGHGHSHGHSH